MSKVKGEGLKKEETLQSTYLREGAIRVQVLVFFTWCEFMRERNIGGSEWQEA